MAFKLAMIQMGVACARKESNLRHAAALVRQAAHQGAQVVLLPEALTLGWTDPSAFDQADPIPDGHSYQVLRQAALDSQVYVCGGIIEQAGPRVFNSAILISPAGQLLLHHRKLNELAIGHPYYALGDRLQVVDTPLGRLGLMICADAFARGQVITRTLGFMGVQVILSPCSWAVPADHDNQNAPYGRLWLDNYGPVARDFRLWIIGVSNVGWIQAGPWQGRKCIGCSLAVAPDGKPALMGPYGVDAESILLLDITPEPRPAQGDAWEAWWQNLHTPDGRSP